MTSRSGILVLDSDCYGRLSDPSLRQRFDANIGVADWIPAPSQVNLLEAIRARRGDRQQIFATMTSLLEDRPLLPWPFALLKQIGRAVLEGEDEVQSEDEGVEKYLSDPEATESIRNEVGVFMRGLRDGYRAMHTAARVSLRKNMAKRGWKATWPNVESFLEQQWRPSDMRHHFARQAWRGLKLPGEAPVDGLLETSWWSLFLDAEGVGVYWALADKQPPEVHRADLLQLVYLGAAGKRMIATGDKKFLRAASAVLANHPNARAVHIDELLD